MSNWTDQIVGDRMSVDREFNDRIQASQFSNQEWGLIMTATELKIENPEDDERARLVADTSNVPDIIPQLEEVSKRTPQQPGAGGQQQKNGGVFGKLADALGLGGLGGGGSSNEEKKEAAQKLAQEYADQLQRHLERNGRWEEVREVAANDP